MPGPRPFRHAKVRRAKLRHNGAALAGLRRLAAAVDGDGDELVVEFVNAGALQRLL